MNLSQIKVWLLCTDAFSDDKLFQRGIQSLPDCEPWAERKRRIRQFRNPNDKQRSLCAGMLIRHLFDVTKTDYSCLKKSAYGKLYPEHGLYSFNVSHSGRYVALSFGNYENGVDIEKITDGSRIARRFFSPAENAVLPDDNALTFTRIWTRKEAYSKLCGLGLRLPLHTFSVVSPEIPFSQQIQGVFSPDCVQIGTKSYWFQEFQIDEYQITVCSTSAISQNIIFLNADDIWSPLKTY